MRSVFDNGGYIGAVATYDKDISANTIPTNGLKLYVDAGNPASYPGTGSTWTDLSGNGNNMTLTGSPTWSSASGGVLQFTTSQYALSNLNYSTSTFTIMAASRYTSTGGTHRRIISAYPNNWLFGHWSNTEAYYAEGWITNGGANDANWRIYAGLENYAASQRSFYVNNVAKVLNSTGGSAGFNCLSVNRDPYGESSDGTVSFIAVWNRLLTTDEMTMVYNAYKTRLGI